MVKGGGHHRDRCAMTLKVRVRVWSFKVCVSLRLMVAKVWRCLGFEDYGLDRVWVRILG